MSAATNPSMPVPSDPPHLNERQGPDPASLLSSRKYAQALVEFDELIRLYPDLVWAHERRALILATCPDAKIRDGKLAVAAATRAARLTDWKDLGVLMTLAAAYAEAGDFAGAVRWEQRALEKEQLVMDKYTAETKNRNGMLGVMSKPNPERLNLYKAGKPYRMRR